MKKRTKILAICAYVLAGALIFTACSGGGSGPTSAVGSSAPKSQVSGYYAAEQSVSGGTDLNVINLKDIKIEKKQSDTEITFWFVEGSINLGMQEKDVKGVPKYSTQWFEGLDRLELKFTGLYYWDYEVYEDEIADTPILGIFRQNPVDSSDTKLYINLKDKIAYKIVEENNYLHLYLRAIPDQNQDKSSYYVIVNAFDEYTNGNVADSEGLYPTLCSDKTNVMLISKPFATEGEANAFYEEKQKTLMPNLPGKVASVVQLKKNELPVYDAKGAINAYAKTAVMRSKDGKESSAEPLITNGRFLCWRPDGMAYVYATPFYLNDSNGANTQRYEKIYLNETGSTTPTLLSDYEYTDISKAEYSEDGRYIAFLDQQGEKQALYVYDTNGNVVYTASETGFGDDTAAFTWGSGDTAHTIFAITGEDSSLQLMSYELKDKLPKVQTLQEDGITGGTMGFYGGKIYYSQYSDDASQDGIYSFDIVSRQQARVCAGTDFMLSRQTGNIAVLQVASDQDATYNLIIYSIKTGQQKTVAEAVPLADSVWSSDGSTLNYTVYNDDASAADGAEATATASSEAKSTASRFTLTLNRYNVQSGTNAEICDIVEGALAPSDKNQEILLTCLFTQEDQVMIPITFRVTAGQ